MASTLPKIFGKVKPSADTDTELCTIATGKHAQLMINCTNQHASNPDKIRIALTLDGDTLDPIDYLVYDAVLVAGGVFGIPANLGPEDFITVRSDTGTTSFVAHGLEVTP